jgi:hypothetical protein
MGGKKKKDDGRFRLADFLIILLCLSGAAFCVNLFRMDLFSTLDSKNAKPVGTIVIKNNIVQRRMAGRVLWDRLAADSPAYMGDLIRTADLSDAVLRIGDDGIDLHENTLIRIWGSPDGDGLIRIDLDEGSLGLATGSAGGGVILSVMGREVRAGPGTVLKASAGKDGVAVQVSRGSAEFIDGGLAREIPSGSMIALDSTGAERMEKAAMAVRPRPNARYLKNTSEPLRVDFEWGRINLGAGEPLRLEIASDRNFKKIVSVIDNLDSAAEADIGPGPWHWRLSLEEREMRNEEASGSRRVILTERFVVADAAGPALISPVADALFRYQDDPPQTRFQWSETEAASFYILEASATPDFASTWIHMQTASVYLLDSSMGQGTWHWRVMPVFPPAYEGGAAFSPAAYFRMERGGPGDAALVLPEIVITEPALARQEPVVEQPVMEEPAPVPVSLSLLSPAQGTSLAGLTALRQQTVFRWSGEGDIERSRFVLSKNRNPLQGRPEAEIINPNNTVRLNGLKEGTYYWTVEARSPDGLVSSARPRQLRVLPIPLLPAPQNLRPPAGHRIGIEQLRESNGLSFSWSAVRGANAYILTVYEVTDNGRRQAVSRTQNGTAWTLDSLAALGRGTFSWRVEAVNRSSAGAVDQRGRIGEGSFVIDIPRPGIIEIEDPGILYGY